MPYAQHCGVGEETVWGTPVARTHFMKVMQGSNLELFPGREVSAKIAANVGGDAEGVFDTGQWATGKIIVPLSYDDRARLKMYKHWLGLLATTGAGPFAHAFTRKVGPPYAAGAVSTAQGLSVELNYELPDAGPLEARLLEGGVVKSGTLEWNAGQEIFVDFDLLGERTTQVIKSGAVTYPDYETYEVKFAQVTLTIDGTAFHTVTSGVRLTIDNKHEPRIRLGAVTTQRPVRRGKSDINGSLSLDWETSPGAKTLWDTFVANGADSLVVTLTGPTNYSEVITVNNIKYTASQLQPEEGQIQPVTFDFMALHDATNTAVKIVSSNQTASI